MAQKTTTVCDRCGREKGKETHWYAVKIQGIQTQPFQKLGDHGSIHIESAQPDIPAGPERLDLCGEQCVIEAVQEWLTNASTL